MPVEIRELIIRAFIEPESKKENKANKDMVRDEESNCPSSEEIEQLLEIINNKNER